MCSMGERCSELYKAGMILVRIATVLWYVEWDGRPVGHLAVGTSLLSLLPRVGPGAVSTK